MREHGAGRPTSRYEPVRFARDITLHPGEPAAHLRELRPAPQANGSAPLSGTDAPAFSGKAPAGLCRALPVLRLRLFSHWPGRTLKYYCERGKCFPIPSVLQGLLLRPRPGPIDTTITVAYDVPG